MCVCVCVRGCVCAWVRVCVRVSVGVPLYFLRLGDRVFIVFLVHDNIIIPVIDIDGISSTAEIHCKGCTTLYIFRIFPGDQ